MFKTIWLWMDLYYVFIQRNHFMICFLIFMPKMFHPFNYKWTLHARNVNCRKQFKILQNIASHAREARCPHRLSYTFSSRAQPPVSQDQSLIGNQLVHCWVEHSLWSRWSYVTWPEKSAKIIWLLPTILIVVWLTFIAYNIARIANAVQCHN